MKILIVEDDPSLREMLAYMVAKRLNPKFELAQLESFAHIELYNLGEDTLLLAERLDQAQRLLGHADAVLCENGTALDEQPESGGRQLPGGLDQP